jgi:NAD(P)-dependent dehydrogenase (short-subunit alcohol dehydrogenase family)
MAPNTIVIVGAAGAIGSEVVKQSLAAGYAVAAVGRSESSLMRLRTALGSPSDLSEWVADAAVEGALAAVFRELLSRGACVGALVHAAGLPPDPETPLLAYRLADWNATFHVYATGVFVAVREALQTNTPGMHVVVLSSAVTRFRSDNLPPIHAGHYAAAKAAVDELCKWARREAHEQGMLLSRIAPAAVDTPFHRMAPTHRRPRATIPLDLVARTIVDAIQTGREIDTTLLPTQ